VNEYEKISSILQEHTDRVNATPEGILIEANELYILAKNDHELHTQQELPIINNLDRKVAKGGFDFEKSVKLWGYLIANINRKYKTNVGPAGRDMASRRMALDYLQEIREGIN